MKKRLSAVFSICVICALILTSCGIFPDSAKKDEEKKIREAVGNYFDEMQDGNFASNDFSDSDYVSDDPFAELLFEQDSAQEIMGQAMSVLEYEIMDASCDKDMETGECEVKLTYVDLDAIIEDLDEGMTSDALSKAVLDKDAPTTETEITLEMTAEDSDWVIEDSTEIAKLLGKPYARITFAADVAEFAEAIDLLFTSLSKGDMEAVDALSPDFDSADFFAVAPEDVPLWEAFFGAVEFEVIGEPRMDGDTVIVDVSLSFPNMTEISQELAEDDERMLVLTTNVLTNMLKKEANEEDIVASFSLINEEVSSAFPTSTLRVDVEKEFIFRVDSESGDLIFSSIPTVLFAYTIDDDSINYAFWKAAEPALNNLYESGDIDLEQYNQWYSILVGVEDVPDVSGEELINDINTLVWCHYLADNISIKNVTEYVSDETYYLCYKLYFNSDWAGAKIYFVWFDEDNNQIGMYEGTVRSNPDGGSYVFGDFAMNASASETVPPGTYYVVVATPESVIISEGSVEVK
jgi:hypothetical protein